MRKVYIILLVSIMLVLSSCAMNDINSYPQQDTEKHAPNNPFPQLDPRDF